eukprot:1576104-Pyramimonas_sp.AAC.1
MPPEGDLFGAGLRTDVPAAEAALMDLGGGGCGCRGAEEAAAPAADGAASVGAGLPAASSMQGPKGQPHLGHPPPLPPHLLRPNHHLQGHNRRRLAELHHRHSRTWRRSCSAASSRTQESTAAWPS